MIVAETRRRQGRQCLYTPRRRPNYKGDDMTSEQRAAVSAALEAAESFAEANNLTPNLTTYCEVREMGNGSGCYGVFLFTCDPDGYEVTVRVEITPDGNVWGARGFDRTDSWASA